MQAENRPRNSRSVLYRKVFDSRKRRVRGIWIRGKQFYANLTVTDAFGAKSSQWISLDGSNLEQARSHYRELLVQRDKQTLRKKPKVPKLSTYIIESHLPQLETSGKRPATISKEIRYLKRWEKLMGNVRLDRIQPGDITRGLASFSRSGLGPRTVNLLQIAIRSVLKSAVREGLITPPGPHVGLEWRRVDQKERQLFTPEEIDLFCSVALKATKQGSQFVDYCRFLQYSGCRYNEAMRIPWRDIDFGLKILTVGSQGESKNRKPRKVRINPSLEAHLKNMLARRAPDSQWLFPSPMHIDEDIPRKSFQTVLRDTRHIAGCACLDCEQLEAGQHKSCPSCGSTRLESRDPVLPEKFHSLGFHDFRHHFCSICVMSGIPLPTVAHWMGHSDGGVLVGKVYGHLADSHEDDMAQKVDFDTLKRSSKHG